MRYIAAYNEWFGKILRAILYILHIVSSTQFSLHQKYYVYTVFCKSSMYSMQIIIQSGINLVRSIK